MESLSSVDGVEVVAIGVDMFGDESGPTHTSSGTIRHVGLPVDLPMVGPLKIINTFQAMGMLLLAARRERADVYHCFNVYALTIGWLLSLVQSSDLTYHASEPNGLQIQIEFPGRVGRLMAAIVNSIEGRLAADATAVFAVRSANGEPFERLARSNSDAVVLENVPRLSEFEVGEMDSTPLAEVEEKKVLIYVGGVSERKGGDMMIESMRHTIGSHPDAHLVIIGGGSETYMNHLRDRIGELGLTEHVSLLGTVDYDKVPAYLANATIGFQLYQRDLWTAQSMGSSTVFRFMGAELPLVVTDLPGIGSIVESLDCGLAAPVEDPEAISDAVCRLLDDEDLAEKMGSNGRREVEQRYNWEHESKKYLKHMPVPEPGEA